MRCALSRQWKRSVRNKEQLKTSESSTTKEEADFQTPKMDEACHVSTPWLRTSHFLLQLWKNHYILSNGDVAACISSCLFLSFCVGNLMVELLLCVQLRGRERDEGETASGAVQLVFSIRGDADWQSEQVLVSFISVGSEWHWTLVRDLNSEGLWIHFLKFILWDILSVFGYLLDHVWKYYTEKESAFIGCHLICIIVIIVHTSHKRLFGGHLFCVGLWNKNIHVI